MILRKMRRMRMVKELMVMFSKSDSAFSDRYLQRFLQF